MSNPEKPEISPAHTLINSEIAGIFRSYAEDVAIFDDPTQPGVPNKILLAGYIEYDDSDMLLQVLLSEEYLDIGIGVKVRTTFIELVNYKTYMIRGNNIFDTDDSDTPISEGEKYNLRGFINKTKFSKDHTDNVRKMSDGNSSNSS